MSADLPHTLYKRKGEKPNRRDVDDAERKMRELYEAKRKRQKEEGFTINEVFDEKADMGEENKQD